MEDLTAFSPGSTEDRGRAGDRRGGERRRQGRQPGGPPDPGLLFVWGITRVNLNLLLKRFKQCG